MEKLVPKMACREAQIRDNPRDELYPAEGVRRRCKKILLQFYPAWVRGQEKAMAVAAKSPLNVRV